MFDFLRNRAARALVGVVFLTGAAQAATRVVDTTGDIATQTACTAAANDCSLRGAISGAAAGDIIVFDGRVFNAPRTISLANGQITIDKNLTVSGTGAGLLTIRNTAAAGANSRVFNLTSGAINLSGMTISGGNPTGDGGGIFNTAATTLTSIVVTGNTSGGSGGGIKSSNDLTISSSTISNNRSNSTGGSGGGIDTSGGTLTVTNSTVSGNSTVNSANSQAGGIGIYTGTGAATITNTTITNNDNGGGTNGAGGLVGVAALRNTIAAGNVGNTTTPDISGTFSAATAFNNLVGSSGNTTGIVNGVNGNQSGTLAAPLNPRLTPLGLYGGQTLTHALLVGPASTAIDAGTATGAPATDQRGIARSGNVDIGAYELSNVTAALPNGSVGQPYNQTIVPNTVLGGTDFIYCYIGTLPSGVTTNIQFCQAFAEPSAETGAADDFAPAATLTISGTPITGRTNTLRLIAFGGGGNSASIPLQITVPAPTAVVTISGTLQTPSNARSVGATVILEDTQGGLRTVETGIGGTFTFAGVAAGGTYVISVKSERFQYAPQVVAAVADLTGLTFAPQ